MTREEILENRRVEFEAWVKERGSPNLERNPPHNDYYLYLPTRDAWEVWNAALDSVEIELPITNFPDGCGDCFEAIDIDDMIGSITCQGYKVKS